MKFPLGSNKRTIYWGFGVMVVAILLSLALQYASYSSYNPYIEKKLFENQLHNRIAVMQQSLSTILGEKNSGLYGSENSNFALLERFSDKSEGRFGYALIGENGKPKAWSKNSSALFTTDKELISKRVQFLGNGWYYLLSVSFGQETIWGIFCVKQEYSYQNSYLESEFADGFRLAPSSEISLDKGVLSLPIKDVQGEYLFSLTLKGATELSESIKVGSIVFGYLFLVALLFTIAALTHFFKHSRYKTRFFFSSIAFLTLFYTLFVTAKIPYSFFEQEFFTASYFAVSYLLPSLGAFLLLSLFILIVTIQFSYLFENDFRALWLKRVNSDLLNVLLVTVLSFGYFVAIYQLIQTLVYNSADLSIYFKVTDYDGITYIKIATLVILIFSYQLFARQLNLIISKGVSSSHKWVILILSTLLLWGVSWVIGFDLHWSVVLFYLIIQASLHITPKSVKSIVQYSYFIWLITIFSLFLTVTLLRLNIKKEEQDRRLKLENIAINLTKEIDLNAEIKLVELENNIKDDSKLKNIVSNSLSLETELRNYIFKTYFSKSWDSYDVQIIGCFSNTYIRLNNSLTTNCYNYFLEEIARSGQPVNSSSFFYLIDNMNGRINYLGVIPVKIDAVQEFNIYITLESKTFNEGLGYPELLKSNIELQQSKSQENYSYAKYVNGTLVKRVGAISYPLEGLMFQGDYGSMHEVVEELFSHLVLHSQADTIIVLSRSRIELMKILLVFTLIFTTLFLISSLFALGAKYPDFNFSSSFSIQKRIQFAFVVLVLFLIFTVIIGSISLSIYRFKAKKSEFLTQTIKSVILELESSCSDKQSLSEFNVDGLNSQLAWLSNVFMSDVNVYSLDGELFASSRSVLFDKKLIGKQMDSEAFIQLSIKKRRGFIQEESISNMHYTSAYTVLYNRDNRPVAFVNIPYFTGNRELNEEVASLLVTIMNSSVFFLVFVLALAILLSTKITEPIYLLQRGLEDVKIGERNKKINYSIDDEVGKLILVYNQMVDKLEESALKLARSEREHAWREMAKQVAHEIKNPLTPMKLNVQQLLRAWNDKRGDFDTYLSKVTTALVEQIDNLTVIANDFAHFAKMTEGKFEIVDLSVKLENLKTLFESTEEVVIVLTIDDRSVVTTWADSDQITTVFNNLIKNSIQSTGGMRKALINLNLSNLNDMIVIMVSDNGLGISKDIQHRLFEPNFTTKSSGMGLGLAICRRIIEASGGSISFTTKEKMGSVFEVKLPLKEKELTT